ncbi:MAG: SGNH/GDSL hydrolase family protein [Armatimonadetes bacterium]|nr:SGNH/GDSL hydrolase family protein [Armatimonadota bacterium]
MRMTALLVVFLAGLISVCVMAEETTYTWKDARALTLEGQGWSNIQDPYRRLPEKAEKIVVEKVWGLSSNSAGLAVRFLTNATSIKARWSLISPALAMVHMPGTGMSGLDLYARQGKQWRWAGQGSPTGQNSEATLVTGLQPEMREYILYFPLYNGVTSVEIGIPEGSELIQAAARPRGTKPLVFYGTSITQGGCASRPGMAYPAIIGRRLDLPAINLGFSGAGRAEPEVAELLAELDPSVFIIDPLPNMHAVAVEERLSYLLKTLHSARPDTPVVLVQSAGSQRAWIQKGNNSDQAINAAMQKVYNAAKSQWGDLLSMVKAEGMVGNEGTVDGVHPTDLGFVSIADRLTPAVRSALQKRPRSSF